MLYMQISISRYAVIFSKILQVLCFINGQCDFFYPIPLFSNISESATSKILTVIDLNKYVFLFNSRNNISNYTITDSHVH